MAVPYGLAESSVPLTRIEPGPWKWEPWILGCRLLGDHGEGFLSALWCAASDAAEMMWGVGGGEMSSVHSPFILKALQYMTAHPRLSGFTWQCSYKSVGWLGNGLRVMSEVWQNWGWRIQDSLEHVFGVWCWLLTGAAYFSVMGPLFSPPFSQHLLTSGLLPGEGRIRSCRVFGGLAITQWPVLLLLHSVSQSKSQGQLSGGEGKADPLKGRVHRDTGEGRAKGSIVAGFIRNNQLSILARTTLPFKSRTKLKYPLQPVSPVRNVKTNADWDENK